MAHNGTFSGGSHARNVVKHRNRHSLIAQLAVERNRKSVGFIANLLDQIKRCGAGRQHDGSLVPRHENLLIGLCQAANWYIEAKRLKLLNCSGQLRLAAIDNEQVGTRAKALVRHALGSIATPQNLGHRYEVVRLVQFGLNFKATILALVGTAVGKYHHRSDGKGAVQRRDIETLDAQRRRRQRQRTFELQERLIGAIVSIPRAHHVAHEGMARIFGSHIEQAVLFAALRPMEMARAFALARKPLPQRFGILKLDRKIDLGWNISRLVVIALKKARLKLFLVDIQALIEDELTSSNRSALANDKDTGGRDSLFAIEADDVDIDA